MFKQSAKKIWMPAIWIIAIAIVGVAAIAGSSHLRARSARTVSAQVPASAAQSSRVRADLDALPLAFEANQGQTDPEVKYMARGNGYKLFLTSRKAIMALPGGKRQSEVLDMMMDKRRGPAAVKAMLKKRARAHHQTSPTAALYMNLVGANAHAQLIAEDLQSGKINYFVGKDPSKWHSNIPLYGRVRYRAVYPGIDLAFHGASRQLEFDYLVSPGADPKAIGLSFDGATGMRTNEAGDLVLTTAAGPVELHKPVAYQVKNGQTQPVNAGFVLKSDNEVTFEVGAYDHSRELVIDPTVFYATYFGGGNADYGISITTDNNGDAFIAGATDSPSLPGAGSTGAAKIDAFVTELDPNGHLVKTTVFGGASDDFPGGIAIDGTGIYVAGTTDSSDFPTTAGVAQTTYIGGTTNGANDAFAIKLDPTLTAILWGTYIAGSDSDSGLSVAVDTTTHVVYVAGETYSNNLGGATGGVNPLPNGNAVNRSGGAGIGDGYIAALTADGTAYSLISYIGGSASDLATGVAVDQTTGDVYVSGETISTNLPTTAGVVQPKCGTDQNCNAGGSGAKDDAFVAGITLTGSTPPYAYRYLTYYGGSDVDDASSIAVDGNGRAFVTGSTSSTDLLSTGTTFQNSLLGTQNAFLLELNAAGSAVAYNTYFGGDGTDSGVSIAVDNVGDVHLTGQSTSSSASFPLLNATQAAEGGSSDAFVSVLDVPNNQLLFSTLLGGGGDEDTFQGGIALDSVNNIYVTGDTDSSDFPTVAPVTGGSTYGGGTCVNSVGNNVPCPDAFIASYGPATNPDFAISASALSPASVAVGGSATSTITITRLKGYSGTVNLSCSVQGSGTLLPACSVSSTKLTVTTTGKAAALYRSSRIFYAMWLPVLGLSVVGMGLTGAQSRRKKLFGIFLLGLLMMVLFFMPACSSSSTTVHGCVGCTPPGNYTVTVTGTDSANANLTHDSSPLTLTVQ